MVNDTALAITSKDPALLGRAIIECLSASRLGIPHPTDFKSLRNPVLDLSGYKSYAAFARTTKAISVDLGDDRSVKLVPSRNGGAKEGFVPLLEKTIVISLDTDGELGSAAFSALELSERF